jgi:hypothetical protein
MKKSYAPQTDSVNKILKGINSGAYYTNSIASLRNHGFENMTVDISASEFDINSRYEVLEAEIPEGKRGNLKKYAGKVCEVVIKGIARSGARVEFYIREKR